LLPSYFADKQRPRSPVRDLQAATFYRQQIGYLAPIMKATWRTSLLLLVGVSTVLAHSWNDNSHYVSLGKQTGYYLLRPGSTLGRKLGFDAAPVIDTADFFRHGYGADALAFHFNRAGVLIAPPAYIYQGLANDFYLRRLASFVRGRSTERNVRALFGKPQSSENRPDGYIAYYRIDVYNPFEDRSSGNGRR